MRVARLVRPALSALRDENLCIIRARLEMEILGESVFEVVSVPIHSFARVVMMGADDSIAFILPSTVSNLTYR